MKKAFDIAAQTVTFTFDKLEPVVFHADRASPEMEQQAMYHGWMARLGDCAALERKQRDGSVRMITEAMRREEIARVVEHYESGTTEWRMDRAEAIDPRAITLAGAKGISVAEARKRLAVIEMAALEEAMRAE